MSKDIKGKNYMSKNIKWNNLYLNLNINLYLKDDRFSWKSVPLIQEFIPVFFFMCDSNCRCKSSCRISSKYTINSR
jgi:hypothetical protein